MMKSPRQKISSPRADHSRRVLYCPSRPGVVIVITLLAIFLLAGVVFWVINTGRQVNARVVTQHAADSAALSSAQWVARAFNNVAMNNVAISRYIAVIHTLDSTPLVTAAALHEQTFLRDALKERYQGLATGSSALNQNATREFGKLLDELDQEVQTLDGVDQYYRNYDVTEMTHFDGPRGRGQIWQAMQSLDELNQTQMENLLRLAQVQGNNAGAANLPDHGNTLIVPGDPDIRWARGGFADFQRPVRSGLIPHEKDDPITNRGPYDTIFGWRGTSRVVDPNDPGSPGYNTIDGIDTSGTSQPFGGGPNAGSRGGRAPGTIAQSYYTYGTHAWTLDRLRNWANRAAKPNLNKSRFGNWITLISNVKLGYVWPGTAIRYFAQPVWDPLPPEDLPLDPSDDLPFSETGYFRLDIKSRYPRTDGRFMTESGSWAYEDPANGYNDSAVRVVRQRGWWLPNTPAPSQRMRTPDELVFTAPNARIIRAAEFAWVYEYSYRVIEDPEIGIRRQTGPNGSPIAQTAYFVQVVIFAGVNRNLDYPAILSAPNGDDDPLIVNPYEGFSPDADDAPAPIDLTDNIDPRETKPRSLSLLAVSTQADTAIAWPTLFDSRRPYPRQSAIAQAGVFNNHSFDLWTQMWHAQLEPITQYESWIESARTAADAGFPNVSDEQADGTLTFLESLTPLAPIMLNH